MKSVSAGLSLAFLLLQPVIEKKLQDQQQPAIEKLQDQLFIGQVYPSGNVYVKSFSGSRAWPKELSLVPLVSDGVASKATRVSETMQPAYIPAIEGMDDQHDACGPLPTRALDLSFEYLSDEFFDGMIDYCETNEDVAVYHTSPSQFSFTVLAFGPEVASDDVRLVEGPRPMTAAEEQRTAAEKQQGEKIAGACTTVPAYVDSAARYLEAGLGNGVALRLSAYKNPGCTGHLSTIYLIDILRSNNVLTTFQLIQNHGVL
jgi:hypothetical protein